MKYIDWFSEHAYKHKKIVDSLSHLKIDKIIEYFDYDNMRQKHSNFCPLYASNSKCHDMKKLNCYLCGCPYFRFDDNGLYLDDNKNMVYSYCIKNYGEKIIAENKIHQDCSKCTIPHTKKFISENFNLDWKNIMKYVTRP